MGQDDGRAQSPVGLARAGDTQGFRAALDELDDDDLAELMDELEAEKLFGAAESVYRALIERNPEDPDHWENLGYNLYYQQRDAERADAHYLQGIERFPKNGHLKVARGINLVFGLGRSEDAVDVIEAAVKLSPKNSWYRAALAWCLLGMGRTEEGLRQARRALRLLEDDEASDGGDRVEMNTFIYLAGDEAERRRALRSIARDFQAGGIVEGGDFGAIVRRARENGHPEAERLVMLTKVLCGEAPAAGLSDWPAWQMASRSFTWPEDVSVPAVLDGLVQFANEQEGRFAGTFELEHDETGEDSRGAPSEAARDLAVFGREPDGALYALWLVPTRDPERAPVVYLSNDHPGDSRVVTANLRDFLALLGLCLSNLGASVRSGAPWATDALGARAEGELTETEEAFREWLAAEHDLAPPSARAAEALVDKTRALSATFATWIAECERGAPVEAESAGEPPERTPKRAHQAPAPSNELRFDWSRLTHVYGSAADVPDLFLDLLHPDQTRHTEAMNDLVSCLYHQKDVTEATAAFVLILGEELKRGRAARRPSALLDLLALFASAAESFDPNDDASAEEALDKVRRGVPIRGEFGSMNTSEAADAVWAALKHVIPIVTPFLMRDDCVTDAARFVARMGSHAHSLHRHVARALDREPDDGAQRAALLAAFSATGRSPDSDVTERLRAALTDEAGDVRAVAALALAQRLGPECDSSVIDVLASLDWEEIPDVVELQTSEDVATCLEEKGTVFLYAVLRQTQTFDDAIGVLCTLAERVTGRYVNRGSRKGRDHSGIDYVELMGAPNPPSEPSSLEELELWRIAASTDVVWAGRTNLFELLGVPADRAELARLAGS